MAQFVVEFSPPVKIKSKQEYDTDTIVNYCLVLAPFQKQTQVEFSNIKIKETAVRYLTVTNPIDKSRQFVLPPSSDGLHFDVHEFTLPPNSQRELTITWKPSVCGNMRKLIKIEQIDNNRKYDFIVLGNCIDPSNKKFKSTPVTYLKSKNSSLIKKQLNCSRKKIILNKTRVVSSKSERIVLVGNTAKLAESTFPKTLQSPSRRKTYLVGEKENLPRLEKKIFGQDLTDSDHRLKRPDKKRHDSVFNNHFKLQYQNKNCNLLSDDSLDESPKIMDSNNSLFNDLCLTPLKSSENILSPFSTSKLCKSFDVTDENLGFKSFNTSPFQPIDASTGAKVYTPEEKKPTRVSVNLGKTFEIMPENESCSILTQNTICSKTFTTPENNKFIDFKSNNLWKITPMTHHTRINSSSKISKRPAFAIRNSPYYKCSPKSVTSKNRLKQYCVPSPRTKRIQTPKMDKCDQYLKCLANPELVYHSNAEDPFLKMSQYYEAQWLDRQEADMIRWLNILLMPTDKLVDEEQMSDLEDAAIAWEKASKTSYQNKPLQFATQKDLFAAQIYRQSSQQWSALRKATSNLITSTKVATVLSKLTVSIEKDLIAIRDDRQIHLDLNLKKKITDLLNCYNPLWLRIGLEAIYGQVVLVKLGSNDLDGLGWFIRKNLFSNDYIKQKFTKTNILQVNLPSYNVAMKKFILKKILMLIYFLDCAKEQQLIRHNPCLFKTDSPYKSSYDFLLAFCANMVTSHGDIIRRLRVIDYNLSHKQTYLDEVDYAVKSLNDLRDGTRITKVVEILFKGDPLSHKLRLPAISKLQKIHNVNLALTKILEHVNIEGNISKRDIVNGHREKILSLFWQIIYKYLTPRYNSAATKIQNWWRNSSLKLVIIKRIRAKQTLKRHMAASKLQSYVRGYLARKRWPQTQTKLVENREKLHLASTTIKRYLQNKLKLLTEERKQFIILRRTVVFVQRKFRSNIKLKRDQQHLMRAKQSALLIQKVYRGYFIRKNWPLIKNSLLNDKTKRINAINIIKRVLRKNLPPTEDELCYKKLKLMTLVIQKRFRATNLMKVQMTEFLSLKKSAIIIQQWFRSIQAMKSKKEYYLKLKNCTIKLQAKIRGFLVRKQWPALRKQLMVDKMYLISCSDIIKRALRRNLPLTYDRVQYLDLKYAAIVFQTRFRAMKEMKQQKEIWPSLRHELQANKMSLIKSSNIIKRVLRKNLPLTEERIKFIKLKKSVIVLQTRFRAMRAMQLQREQWPTLRSELQANKLHLINSSNIIKRTLRKNLPPTEDHLRFNMLKRSVIVLQTRFRAMRAMKLQREKWPGLRCELQANKLRLINSSNIIKRALRKNLPLTQDYVKFIKLRQSVMIIQTRYRALQAMKLQREQYLHLKAVTLQLQSLARGYLFRKQWPLLHNDLMANRQHLIYCSNVIKKTLRKNLPPTDVRLKYIELKRATLVIQNKFRVNRQVKEYQLLRNNIIVIQRRFKANMAMKRQKEIFKNTKAMTIRLQAHIRSYLARKHWQETKCVLEAHQKQLIKASNTIKKFLRKCLPPTLERLKYLQVRQSVLNLQARYRAIIAMRSAKRNYLLLKNCVITLQSHYRAQRAMLTQKRQYKCLKNSVIVLQAYIRGYLARKHWPQLKDSMETSRRHKIAVFECKKLVARHAFLIELNLEMRAAVQLQNWTRNVMLIRKRLQKENAAAIKLQASVRGFLVRKKLPKIKHDLHVQKLIRAATMIQSLWRGYRIRKRFQCRRETKRAPIKAALTLGRRHNDVVDIISLQKRSAYSYRELTTVFWNLDTCTALSKELCLKTVESSIINYMLHFLQYSNQSQPSIEAREPAIRVLTNLLKYEETSWRIWMKLVHVDMVKELIKIMKTCCGKIYANKLYCSIATCLWIAMQDPEKKLYIKNLPSTIVDFSFMIDTLNKKYRTRRADKKTMLLPSTWPSWNIGAKCQKCFDSDHFATAQICKLLNIYLC